VTWVAGHIYIVGVQLSQPLIIMRKVEHPKTEDTQGGHPHIIVLALAKKETAGS